MKRFLRIAVFGIVLCCAAVLIVDRYISYAVKEQMYNNVNALPGKKIGLLLGTSKYLDNGMENLYYRYRINAARDLFKSGKVKYILISGDNSREDYSEPDMMKADLLAAGVPEQSIFLDYAGFRTLDSIMRCKLVFGEDDIIIISQAFHNERALYIADQKHIKAIGYNAQDVTKRYGFKTMLREKLARMKLLLDLCLGRQPKYLGPHVSIS